MFVERQGSGVLPKVAGKKLRQAYIDLSWSYPFAERRFKDNTPLQAAIINFNAAKQNDGESAADFLERLQLLADKAYPEIALKL